MADITLSKMETTQTFSELSSFVPATTTDPQHQTRKTDDHLSISKFVEMPEDNNTKSAFNIPKLDLTKLCMGSQ